MQSRALSRLARTWRALAALPLLLGCSQLLTLGELEKADCVGTDCDANGGVAGTRNYKAGASSTGATATQSGGHGGGAPVAGSGSTGNPEGGNSANMTTAGTGGSSGGNAMGGGAGELGISGGNGGNAMGGSGGSGSNGGSSSAGTAGAPLGGVAGQPALGGCKPVATDDSCDGLDAACQPTDSDVACSAFCLGQFVAGSSYMSCVDAASYDQAIEACAKNGMRLVKIDSEQENETVWNLALDDYVWLGGSNRDDQSRWAWPDGTPFLINGSSVGDTYQSFPPGQPVDDPDIRCAEMDADGWWSNWYCSEPQSFVCERY